MEPHLSATVLLLAIGAVLLVVGGIPKRYIVGGLGAGVGLVVLSIVTGLISYGSDRIKYWLDPWSDPLGNGFQTIQSLLAIGSGGILGRGIGQSRQKYLWVPEPHNDFIFSIVCEELGLIGAIVIILLFCLLLKCYQDLMEEYCHQCLSMQLSRMEELFMFVREEVHHLKEQL
jgi:cell division protein FtsW